MCESLFLNDKFLQGALLNHMQVQMLLDSNKLKGVCDLNVTTVDFWLVISHDCDLARPADKDCLVELLPCHKKFDDTKPHLNGFSSRQLEILIDDASYVIFSFEKHSISKYDLIQSGIIPSGILNDRDLKLLYTWLPTRYVRTNVPEDLNRVLNNAFNNRKLKITKPKDAPNHQGVIGLWFKHERKEDIDGSCKYYLIVYVIYSAKNTEGQGNAKAMADMLKVILSKEPIIDTFRVYSVSANELTFDVVLDYNRWTYDYLCV